MGKAGRQQEETSSPSSCPQSQPHRNPQSHSSSTSTHLLILTLRASDVNLNQADNPSGKLELHQSLCRIPIWTRQIRISRTKLKARRFSFCDWVSTLTACLQPVRHRSSWQRPLFDCRSARAAQLAPPPQCPASACQAPGSSWTTCSTAPSLHEGSKARTAAAAESAVQRFILRSMHHGCPRLTIMSLPERTMSCMMSSKADRARAADVP